MLSAIAFDVKKIDSIEFYGSIAKYYRNTKRQPFRSLLIIYFNDSTVAESQLDELQTNWKNNFRGIESMFKSGGIGLALNGQLCIYSVDACASGYNNILRVDSVISEKVFQGMPFKRLHSKCGMGPFIRVDE